MLKVIIDLFIENIQYCKYKLTLPHDKNTSTFCKKLNTCMDSTRINVQAAAEQISSHSRARPITIKKC
jgi:hypothetical protein